MRKRVGRGTREQAIRALDRLDRILSDAQDVIGRDLTNMETKEKFPEAYRLGDDVYGQIEKIRRRTRPRSSR